MKGKLWMFSINAEEKQIKKMREKMTYMFVDKRMERQPITVVFHRIN